MSNDGKMNGWRAWLAQDLGERGLTWSRQLVLVTTAVSTWLGLASAAVPLSEVTGLVPHPGLRVMVIVSLLSCYLAVRNLLFSTPAWTLMALAGLQLVSLLVGPWPWSPAGPLLLLLLVSLAAMTAGEGALRQWAARLPALALSLTYLMLVARELSSSWLSGATLRSRFVDAEGSPGEHWALAAGVVLAAQLYLVVALHLPRLRSWTLVVGLVLHVLSAALRVEPTLVTVLALAVYLPLVADRLLPDPRGLGTMLRGALASTPFALDSEARKGTPWLVVALLAVAAVLLLVPLAGMGTIVALVSVVALAAEQPLRVGRSWRALAHVVAAGFLFVAHLGTDQATRLVERELIALEEIGDDAGALLVADELLLLDPSRKDLRLEMAERHREVGNLTEARAAYQAIVDDQPGFVVGWVRLGRIHGDLGDWEDALEAYRQADRFKPGVPGVQVLMGLCLDKIVSQRHPSVDGWPAGSRPEELSQAFIHYLEGAKGHRALEQNRKALHALLRAVVIERDNAPLCLLIGEVYEELGQKMQAQRWVLAALEREPSHAGALAARDRLLAAERSPATKTTSAER
ncbi:MAG: tetratricopeptide repeat protein [Acidobacteriota bacterium]